MRTTESAKHGTPVLVVGFLSVNECVEAIKTDMDEIAQGAVRHPSDVDLQDQTTNPGTAAYGCPTPGRQEDPLPSPSALPVPLESLESLREMLRSKFRNMRGIATEWRTPDVPVKNDEDVMEALLEMMPEERWVEALATVNETHFWNDCSELHLDYAGVMSLKCRFLIHLICHRPEMQQVERGLEKVFWISPNPRRRLQTWMTGCFLQFAATTSGDHLAYGPGIKTILVSKGLTDMSRFRHRIPYLIWGVPMTDVLVCYRDKELTCEEYRSRGRNKCKAADRMITPFRFARSSNSPMKTEVRSTLRSSDPQDYVRSVGTALFNLFTPAERQLLRGINGRMEWKGLTECSEAYLHAAGNICYFINMPVGTVHRETGDRLKEKMTETIKEMKAEGKSVRNWLSRSHIYDTWVTGCLLERSQIDLDKLAGFCVKSLKCPDDDSMHFRAGSPPLTDDSLATYDTMRRRMDSMRGKSITLDAYLHRIFTDGYVRRKAPLQCKKREGYLSSEQPRVKISKQAEKNLSESASMAQRHCDR